MRKINLRKEKQERNKLYAKRFEKSYEEKQEQKKRERQYKGIGGKWGRWCRIKGHPPECSCVYPIDLLSTRTPQRKGR